MALPLIAIGTGLGAGLLGGFVSSLLGGGKKGEAAATQTTTYHPYAFYQPSYAQQIQYPDYQFIIDSPGAGQELTKKQAITQQPSIAATITATPTGVLAPETAGASMMPFVLVGGAVVIGYTLLKKKR